VAVPVPVPVPVPVRVRVRVPVRVRSRSGPGAGAGPSSEEKMVDQEKHDRSDHRHHQAVDIEPTHSRHSYGTE
jgi:hypothetical protein